MKPFRGKTSRVLRRNYASLLFLALPAVGQPNLTGSFRQAIAGGNPLPWEVSQRYAATQPDSAVYFLNQSLQTAQQQRDSLTVARALCQLAWVYLYYRKDQGKFIQYARRALAVAQARQDYNHLTEAYRLLGTAAMHQQADDPEAWFSQAVRFVSKTNDWRVQATLYGTLTQHYEKQKKYSQAEQYNLLAMSVNQQHDPPEWFIGITSYCDLLEAQNKHQQAVAFARRMNGAKAQLPGKPGEFVYDNELARLALFQENYAEAERYLLAGLAIQKARSKPDSVHLYYYYKNLISVYTGQKAYQKAFETANTLAEIRLWIQRIRQTRDSKLQMTELKAATDLAKKQTEINLLATQKRQQQLLLIGATIIALLLIGFALILQRAKRRIEQQNTALSRLNATKDKLFAILSHDLRSPVANLRGYLTLHNWGALSNDEFNQSASSLGQRLSYVQTLLDNLLNWAMTQMAGINAQPEHVSLEPLIAGKIQLLLPLAEAKGIQLLHQILPTASLYIDLEHLKIIVRNLLQNAIKFTHSGGQVTVQYAESEDRCELIIADTGIGIPPDLLPKLFLLEAKTSQPGTANEPGTGLGLLLVKELVTVNGGQIAVESEVGKGTTFRLTFDVVPAP